MKNLFGSLLLFLTLMVSAMALYLNAGVMLYDESVTFSGRLASVLFMAVWAALSAYSAAHKGVYSVFMCAYWVFALSGAVFCVLVTSGLGRILEYAAYFLLLPLTPLFGLRLEGHSHFAWAIILFGMSLSYASAAVAAVYRRPA